MLRKRPDRRDDRHDHMPGDPAVRRIDTPVAYHGAIGEALGRVAAPAGSVQARRLNCLIAAVEDYEDRNGHDIAEHDKLSVSIGKVRSARGIE